MTKWEYKIVQPTAPDFTQEMLNFYGEQGWELVEVLVSLVCVFKRPLA